MITHFFVIFIQHRDISLSIDHHCAEDKHIGRKFRQISLNTMGAGLQEFTAKINLLSHTRRMIASPEMRQSVIHWLLVEFLTVHNNRSVHVILRPCESSLQNILT